MIYEQAVRKIGYSPSIPAQREILSHANLAKRRAIADRLLGNGILPNTSLGRILAHEQCRLADMSRLMREILTFDAHQQTCQVIAALVEDVESLSRAEVLAEAQKVVAALYQEKIVSHGDPMIKGDFPQLPTVEEFSRLNPNGHFDPYQYIKSDSWGAISTIFSYGKLEHVGYEKACRLLRPERIRDALVMARALEIIP